MRNQRIVALMFTAVVSLLVISHPAPSFKLPPQAIAERNLSATDQDAQLVELRQWARAAMVHLQSLQQDAEQARVRRNN